MVIRILNKPLGFLPLAVGGGLPEGAEEAVPAAVAVELELEACLRGTVVVVSGKRMQHSCPSCFMIIVENDQVHYTVFPGLCQFSARYFPIAQIHEFKVAFL